MATSAKKILAVSSSGGHWIQLLRLRESFAGHRVVFVTTDESSREAVPDETMLVIPDANRSSKLRMVVMLLKILGIVAWQRPDVVISTGAACGYFALRFGKMFGARTVWLESVANSEEPSLSTKLVRPYADLFLTQWPHMAQPDGPFYKRERPMIFLTVGTQLPFDRLIKAMDEWAATQKTEEVFAQTGSSTYVPQHMTWEKKITAATFKEKCRACSLIVAHAGIGSLLSAMEYGKPIVVMPRRADLKEHRNDHQLATAKWLSGTPGLTVAQDADELKRILAAGSYSKPDAMKRSPAFEQLTATLKDFIANA